MALRMHRYGLWLAAGFGEQLGKLAFEQEQKPTLWRRAAPFAGAAGGMAGAAGGLVAARPALRRHFAAGMGAFLKRQSPHAVDRARPIPHQARETARQIAVHLRAQGLDPKKARIGISATGGTGKSTLARGVADELGMQVSHLDDAGSSLKGRDLTKHLARKGVGLGTIAEQTHLLNQVDPDTFDAIIHLEKPMGKVKSQILKRGRGAGQLEVYDYDKLHQAIRTGFDTTHGQAREVSPGIRVKMKGPSGFRAQQMLETGLRAKGIDAKGMTRQQMVISLSGGKATHSPGVWPYVRKGRLAAGAGIVGLGGVGGAVGTQYAAG